MASLSSWCSNELAFGFFNYIGNEYMLLCFFPPRSPSHLQSWGTEQKPIQSLCCLEQTEIAHPVESFAIYAWIYRILQYRHYASTSNAQSYSSAIVNTCCSWIYCCTYDQGWQFVSDTAPDVLARTWANTSGLLIFSASLTKLTLFHAGVTDVKMQGVMGSCSVSGVSLSYHPTPNPSPKNVVSHSIKLLPVSDLCYPTIQWSSGI